MRSFKKFLLIIIFFSISIINVNAEGKIAYLDIDLILANSIAGKSLLNTLKKDEELKINKYKTLCLHAH